MVRICLMTDSTFRRCKGKAPDWTGRNATRTMSIGRECSGTMILPIGQSASPSKLKMGPRKWNADDREGE